ncbi:hypothetical protein EON65_16470 [archaeon]|nr:MAG: hypothetical protein EON65_16470 [archaeon]
MSTISSDPSPLRSCPPNKPNFHSSSFQPPPASTGASNPPSTFVTPYSTLTSVLTPTPNSIPTSIPTPNHTHRALVNLSPTSDPIPETNPRHLPTSLPTQPQTPAFTLLSLPTVPSAIREHFLQTRFLIAISAIPLLHFKSNVYERDRLMRCLTVIVRSTHEVRRA